MLRRKIVGNSSSGTATNDSDRPSRMSARNEVLLSRQEKRALRSLRLLEKVESLGLDSRMPATVGARRGLSPLTSQATAAAAGGSSGSASGFAAGGLRSRTASPMTQLTSLKPTAGSGGGGLYGVSGLDDEQQFGAMRSARSVAESLASLSDSEGSMTTHSLPQVQRPTTTVPISNNNAQTSAGGTMRPVRPGSVPIAAPGSSSDRQTSPTDARLKQMQRQKSRRALLQNGQRPDLGTVAGKVRPDLGRVANAAPSNFAVNGDGTTDYDAPMTTTTAETAAAAAQQQQMSIAQSFVGTISSLFFGRKGGLL